MPSASTIILEYICPIMGTIIANFMFSAPYKAVKKAVAKGSLGDLNPTPWAFMTGNCVGWVTYSFLIQNMFLFFANAPGFLLSVWLNMCASKLQYEAHMSKEMRKSFARFLDDNRSSFTVRSSSMDDGPEERTESRANEQPFHNKITDLGKLVWQITTQETEAPAPHEKIVVAVVIIWTAVISIISFADMTQSTRELIVGIVVNTNLLFFYGAPLSTIFTVLKTRDSSSIHIWTMVTNTANGSFWAAYGIAVMDYFIIVPNGIGAGLGVVQMVLCCTFPRRRDGDGGVDAIVAAADEEEEERIDDDVEPLRCDEEDVSEKGSEQNIHNQGSQDRSNHRKQQTVVGRFLDDKDDDDVDDAV